MSKKPTKQELIDHVESLVAKCEELTRERDEARRAACKDEAIIRLQRNRVHRESEEVLLVAKEISIERGWDCFKKNTDYLQDLG